ncbi:TOMM precursor leader peptide-binding protein [Streptomyces sp. JJ36]|uniref:TOMM precursor leader peptide-binding protein n=1 Tax=Streptomyces sp. JJ36 TaxID=2736645 RepID=UPI001F268DDB|nr:TOMM precursor leader peptide-binding protein [Streptomyces sp. JJ36]MCF6526620.1 TOMM precursor leader peptide-binding protein [Streptomyces sp. JJ36]
MTPTPAPSGGHTVPGAPTPPLEAARMRLQRELAPRFAQFPAFAGRGHDAEPLVVPLGSGLAPGDGAAGGGGGPGNAGAADPYAAVRPFATVHLTVDAVLVGPWGTGGGEHGGCGLCLGLRWSRESRGPGGPCGGTRSGGGRTPELTPFVVETVRGVWRTVFGGGTGPGGAGPAHVTRIDLHTLVTSRFPLPREPGCPHCGPREGGRG